MEYYLLTNPKFTCRRNSPNDFRIVFACQRNPNTIFDTYANNPGNGEKGGRVIYPVLNPRNNISLDDLRGLNLTADVTGGSGPWDPLDYCIGGVQETFDVYFDRLFGQRDKSDEDSDNEEDEKIEEDSFSSDEDKENVNENRD